MAENPEQLRQKALEELKTISAEENLEAWRIKYLGRKGQLTAVLRGLANLPPEERRITGAAANKVKTSLEKSLKEKELEIKESRLSSVDSDAIDITLPGKPLPAGRIHPVTQAINEICDIFKSMGFQIAQGPDVEWEYYNFEALNIPEEHPSRDTMSTYWVDYIDARGKSPMMLRTQGTAVSARIVEEREPPIRTIEPSRVYRYEATDATHLNIFHHLDGIAVDKGINMADLKGTLYEFARRYFGEDRKVRFRVDYFPFVEPGVEMAIDCAVCRGDGCSFCRDSGWLEILGAGMTHPNVLRMGGIDPEEYTSFAFGIGLERLPMLKYGIDDMRLFYTSDLRFLRQF
ncbi:MAG: phenylalanine--tRNA ligase subunit alpha [Dehalococcoidales bacterium]|nr:MAG: phenylalanine--tRNA ligase subunit alpha [Dehalococcoidales bacterium]